jgi:hypothetical protein
VCVWEGVCASEWGCHFLLWLKIKVDFLQHIDLPLESLYLSPYQAWGPDWVVPTPKRGLGWCKDNLEGPGPTFRGSSFSRQASALPNSSPAWFPEVTVGERRMAVGQVRDSAEGTSWFGVLIGPMGILPLETQQL